MRSSKLSICVLGPNDGIGGSQTAFRQLVKFLIEDGHSVGAVSISEESRTSLHGVTFEAIVPRSNRAPDLLNKAFLAWRAGLRCRSVRPDVLISIGLSGQGNLLARMLGKGTFCICQDLSHGRTASDRRLRRAARIFHGIAPQAPSMEASLRRELGEGPPIRWLPCFPEPPALGITARLGVGAGVRLAYFGRVERYKGVHLVLEAMAKSDRLGSVSFDVWGGGSEASNLVAMTESMGLSGRVRFRGRYPEGRDGGELMASYHALVLPTTGNEGLPLILLEAMAYGLPLLATSVAAIPDCCMGNPDAVMVEPTVDGIQAGLETLVAKLERREFVPERAQRFYAERFSRDAMAARWRDFLADPPRFFTGAR